MIVVQSDMEYLVKFNPIKTSERPMKSLSIFAVLCSILFLQGCAGLWPFGEERHFVRVRGTQLMLNDLPYYYAGTNFWYGYYIGSPGSTGDRERLRRELDSLCAIGVTNLRVLGSSEAAERLRAVKPSTVRSPGVYDDTLLLGLDYLLFEMDKRNMKAVIYFSNFWEWSGGFSEYISWANGTSPFDPEKDGWDKFMTFSATFYSNEKANNYYRDLIKKIILRKNIYNGRIYREDPTIMSWQLANEPRPGTNGPETEKNLPAFYRWIDETSGYIKSLDTLHLVSTGNEGLAGSYQSGECFMQAHRSVHVDYLTMHLWPYNWGWFNPKKQEETLPAAIEKATEYINKHLAFARTLNKPIVMEEFGLVRDNGDFSSETPVVVRDKYYSVIFNLVYDSARGGSPFAGTNFWAWGGTVRAKNPDYMWKVGDPFMGDPPQEPQGMNSVFISDRSTLALIREHAMKMTGLGLIDTLRRTPSPIQ